MDFSQIMSHVCDASKNVFIIRITYFTSRILLTNRINYTAHLYETNHTILHTCHKIMAHTRMLLTQQGFIVKNKTI